MPRSAITDLALRRLPSPDSFPIFWGMAKMTTSQDNPISIFTSRRRYNGRIMENSQKGGNREELSQNQKQKQKILSKNQTNLQKISPLRTSRDKSV
jgi:hypothetical protein